jgi:cytochrome c-L
MQTYPTKLAVLLTSSFFVFISSTLTATNVALADNVGFVDTRNGQPLNISPNLFDTEQAKKFMASGQNPYIGNQEAMASGKKLFQLYSCTQCHGAQAQGQTAVGLTGPKFNNAKSATDKGMFEVIWAGTNGGMGGKGKGVMDPTNASNGMSPDEVLKVIAWIRGQGGAAAGK